MRATQTTTYRSLQAFLDRTSETMQQLQLQAATGKKLNRPSDDPTAISPMLSARTQIQGADRYIETIQTGLERVDNMEGYMTNIENTLVRAKEIAIASANGAMSQQDLITYADEVSQLRETLLDSANAQVDGKYLFSGYAEKTKPFSGSPVIYNGDNGIQEFEIAPNELIEISLNGANLMLGDANNDGATDAGAVNIFTVIDNLEANLRAGDVAGLETDIADLETAANQVRTQLSMKGTVGRRLDTALSNMEEFKIDMEEYRSRYEDADILETITSLTQQQQSFEAALNVTGKVSDLSILDYL